MPGVVNNGAVAVFEPRQALAALRTHGGQFLARTDAKCTKFAACRGSFRLIAQLAPAEFVQPLVVDPEVVGDFVDHRDRNLVDHLVLVLAHVEQRLAVDGDGVG
jgi:hypothetical protein